MSTRERAYSIFNAFNEEQLLGFIALFGNFESEIPNEETIEAIEEAERMLRDPEAPKFDSVEALFEDLNA